ncbi:unnamed protein product, partial [Rotaria sp. Silwood2]
KIHDKQSALVEQAHPVNIETMDSSQLNRTIASEYEQLESTPTAPTITNPIVYREFSPS